MNHLFVDEYKDIEFVEPGSVVDNLTALYRLGLFYIDNKDLDYDRHPTNPILGPLQKVAADILGLEYQEIKPRIRQPNTPKSEKKQVCIAIHSTAQTKYWNNPFGWQEVVNWLNNRGYVVKLLSTEHDGYMGNKNPKGVIQFPPSPIEDVIKELKQSHAFIGISSGLSWVSWATGIPTVMISGFTDPINEMTDCIRISAPTGKCSGCWHRYKFDGGDWNWCPDHKGTPRQFECSREITSDMVIRELETIL
jgi:autotransporter strand-loop-strand O-heptosyltransferase